MFPAAPRRLLERRPAAIFLVAPGPLRAGIVQEPPPDILPECLTTIKADGIDLLNLDDPAAAPAPHPQNMLRNLAQSQRRFGGARPALYPRVVQKRLPVFRRQISFRSQSGLPRHVSPDKSGHLIHLPRVRHAPARGPVSHASIEHNRNKRVDSRREKYPRGGPSTLSEPCPPVRLESEPSRTGVLRTMAPRANWKGFLRLSLVTCPVALYPATSESEKMSFNQLNRATGHRIKYLKVDADTGDEVANEDIVKGYELDKGQYIEVTKEELDELALESTRTIEIDEFVDRSDIDPRYLIRPYYLTPDGKIGHDAFAVIRETIREMDKVAIGRVVLTNREHIIALEPMDKGLVGTLLRYPYEVRNEQEYFDEIQDVKVTKDMLDLARHIVNQKTGTFDPGKFEDHYETALVDLINQKRAGKTIRPKERPKGENVVDLMEALRQSVGREAAPAKAAKPAEKPRKAAAGQKEMLMTIQGKKPVKEVAAKKPVSGQRRKSA